MGLIEFLDRNASGVFALGGVTLTLVVNWVLQRSEWAHQKYLRKTALAIDVEKRTQFDPIAEFVECYLSLVQTTYAAGLSKDQSATPDMPADCNMKMLAASARVKLYRDPKLNDMFESLSRKRIEIGNCLFDVGARDVNRAYALLREAENTAAEILGTLKSKLLESAA